MKLKIKFLVLFLFSVVSFMGGSVFAQTVNATGTNSNCPNETSVVATTSGLAGPVGFQLLSGSTIVRPFAGSGWDSSGNFTNLPAGTYTVKARGNNDDSTIVTSTNVTTVVNYTPLTVSVSPVTKVACPTDLGSLTVVATGGSGNYGYGITPVAQNTEPSTYQASATFTGLAPGSYKFWVKDNTCSTAVVANTTGSYTIQTPLSASVYTVNLRELRLQNPATATGGYKVVTDVFFRGSYIYMTTAEQQLFTIYIKDLTTGITYPEQPISNKTINLPPGDNVLGHTLKLCVKNICDNSVKELDVYQTLPIVNVTASCGTAQINYQGYDLISYPATFVFTDTSGLHPENTKTVIATSNVLKTLDFTPNTYVDWKIIDNDGKTWPGSTLDFTKDLTNGGTNLSFYASDPDNCKYNESYRIIVTIKGIPPLSTGVTYVVTASDNPLVSVGKTGRFIPFGGGGSFIPEFTLSPSSNNWPGGHYTLMLKMAGCYDGKTVDVTANGLKPVVTDITKTAICGSFNFTVNGVYDSLSRYELIIVSGPGATAGTTRAIISSATTFTNMPYGTYTLALRVIGSTGTCRVLDLDPFTFTASSTIGFDALSSGGFACDPSGKGDIVVEASTVVSGATLEYSIDNGASWQSSNRFANVNTGTYSVKIRETACGTVTTQTVQVISNLMATINNNPAKDIECVGDPVKLDINALGGTAYTWTYPDGSTHSGKQQNLGNATSAMAGDYYVVVSNTSCSSDPIKVHLDVLDKPSVNTVTNIVEHKKLLINIPITGIAAKKYSDATTSVDFATTYNWANDNTAIGLATSGSGPISFTGTNLGSTPIVANITVTPTTASGCPGTPKTFTITILPDSGAITGATSLCSGSTAQLSDARPNGVWSSSSTAVATVDTTGLVTGVSAGTATISYTIDNNGYVATATQVVTVNPLPIVEAITGNTTVCSGSTTQLNDVTLGGSWSSSNTAIANVNATGLVTGVSAGTATISYTVTNVNSCNDIKSILVTINALPATPILSAVTQPTTCAMANGTFQIENYDATIYTYKVNPSAGVTVSATGLVKAPEGSYTVTTTNITSGCVSAPSATATINAAPTAPASPTLGTVAQPTTCASPNGSFQIESYDTATYNYAVNPATGVTVSATGLVTAPAGNYTVTITNKVSGCTSPASASATVNAAPTAPTAPTLGTVTQPTTCATPNGSFQINSYDAATYTYAVNPATGVTVSATGLVTAPAGSYTVTLTNKVSGCTSVPSATATVNVITSLPLALTPSTQTICSGDQATLTVSGDNGGVVSWTSNYPGLSGTGTTFNTGTLTNEGTSAYTVLLNAAVAAGSCSGQETATVTILPQPRVIAAPSSVTVCSYEVPRITLTSVLSGTAISWELINTVGNNVVSTGSGTDNVVFNNTVPSGSYTLKVTGTKDGCTSVTNVSLTVN